MKNLLYPALPNYKGKTKGFFTLLHHAEHLIEWSDNVMERIEYIIKEKPEEEREIRLRHIMYVPDSLIPVKLRKALAASYKARAAYKKARAASYKALAAFYKASAALYEASVAFDKEWAASDKSKTLLAYLQKHVQDCLWNGTEIVFPPKI